MKRNLSWPQLKNDEIDLVYFPLQGRPDQTLYQASQRIYDIENVQLPVAVNFEEMPDLSRLKRGNPSIRQERVFIDTEGGPISWKKINGVTVVTHNT
jgi:hypothetical protein